MIKTQRITSTTSKIVPLEDFISINVLKWKNSKWKELCPYYLKTDGQEECKNEGNVIFENFWQGCKVFDYVYDIEVYPHKNWQGNPEYLWWKYETENGNKDEIYNKDEDRLNLKLYKRWRNSLWRCENPIRYPNGIHRRKNTQFSLIIDKDKNKTRLNYIEARKRIYIQEFSRLIRKQEKYKLLLQMLKDGKNLLICEVDVPSEGKKGEYGKNIDEYGNFTVTEKRIRKLIENDSEAFGHGLVICKCLLEDLKI